MAKSAAAKSSSGKKAAVKGSMPMPPPAGMPSHAAMAKAKRGTHH